MFSLIWPENKVYCFLDAAGPSAWKLVAKTSSCASSSWRWCSPLRKSGPCFSSRSYTSPCSAPRLFCWCCATDVSKRSSHQLRAKVTAACVFLRSEAARTESFNATAGCLSSSYSKGCENWPPSHRRAVETRGKKWCKTHNSITSVPGPPEFYRWRNTLTQDAAKKTGN